MARLFAVALAGGFLVAVMTPREVKAAGVANSCLLGVVCTATPTPTPASVAASPAPTPTGLLGTVTGTVHSTTGTVTSTVTGTVNTVKGLLGSSGPTLSPTLSPTPCVLNCDSATPTPPSSGSGSPGSGVSGGSGTGSGDNSAPSDTGSAHGAGTRSGPAALHGQLAAQSVDLATPPSVLGLGPIPGIDFGNAPFLWPLFLALDVAAFGAVVYVIRKKGFVAKD